MRPSSDNRHGIGNPQSSPLMGLLVGIDHIDRQAGVDLDQGVVGIGESPSQSAGRHLQRHLLVPRNDDGIFHYLRKELLCLLLAQLIV